MAITVKKKRKPDIQIMGLDISTKTGVAMVGVTDARVEILETAEYTAQRAAGNIARGDAIWSQVLPLVAIEPPDIIIIEGYGYGNQHTLVLLVEIGTIFRHELYKYGVSYYDVPPTSLKKFVTGKGNTKKDMMMKEVYKRWGYEGTDNQCDAVALAMFGAAMLGVVDMPKVNLSAVTDYKKIHEIP